MVRSFGYQFSWLQLSKLLNLNNLTGDFFDKGFVVISDIRLIKLIVVELVSKLRTGLDVHGGQIPALLQSKLGADRNLYGRKQHLDKRSKGAKHKKSYLIAAHGSQDQDQSKDSGSVGVQAR